MLLPGMVPNVILDFRFWHVRLTSVLRLLELLHEHDER